MSQVTATVERTPPEAGTKLLGESLVAALYPLCRWFSGVRQRRRDAWLSYL